jgi:hypothetical protein
MKTTTTITGATTESPDAARPLASFAVVIAWVNPYELIEPGLRLLLTGATRKPDEIVVITRHDAALRNRLQSAFPEVTIIPAPRGTTIPKLRSIGIQASSSSVVLVTEDHCVPAPDWIEHAASAISGGSQVVGGPVENVWTFRLRDWAAFLTEYAGAVRSAVPGVENGLPGNNIAYRREVAEEIARTLDADLWESFEFAALERRGVRFTFDPDMLVYHRRPFGFFYFLGQRYHFCRAFAEMRRRSLSPVARTKYAAGCVLLPGLLLLRSLRCLIDRRRLLGRFAICLPLIVMYLIAGAFGEMLGYLFGGARSLERVE